MAWYNRLGKFLTGLVTGTTESAETAEESAEEAQQEIDYGVEPDDSGYYPEPTAEDLGGYEGDYVDQDWEREISIHNINGDVLDSKTKAEWMLTLTDSDTEELQREYGLSTRDIIDELIGQGEWDDGPDSPDWAEFRDGYEKAHPGALHYTPYNRGGSSGYRVGA